MSLEWAEEGERRDIPGGSVVMTAEGWLYAPSSGSSRRRPTLPPQTCPTCSAVFAPGRRGRRHCSHSCATTAARGERFWSTRK